MTEPAKDTRHLRRMLVAFAAVAVAFLGTTLFAESRALPIDDEARDLATNALPSIQHLTAATAALRKLEAQSDDLPETPEDTQAAAREQIEKLRRLADAELEAYLESPVYAGEHEQYAELPPKLILLDEALGHLDGAIQAHDQPAARAVADHEVRRTVGAAADILQGLIAFNLAGAHENTARIVALRTESMRAALGLDALSVGLAFLAMMLTVRAVRRYTAVLQAHGNLVERRADELERFGERIAHDLLSPLSALSFCLDAIKRATGDDPRVRDPLRRATLCVTRARDMTRGIFDFARSGARPEGSARADLERVLSGVVDEVLASQEDPPEIRVEPFAPRALVCSEGVLASILANLLRNAAKYTRDSALRQVTVRVQGSDGRALVEVEDSGPGLPPGLEEHLFEPYVRASGLTQPGLGLGLATVKRLCEAHGGSVGVRPAPGHGCLFWFELPALALEEAPSSGVSIQQAG